MGLLATWMLGRCARKLMEAWSAAAKVGEVLRVAQGRGDAHGVQMRADTDTSL